MNRLKTVLKTRMQQGTLSNLLRVKDQSTVLKTRMQQGTLSNLLRVKDQSTVLKEFDPDSAIDQWLL